MTDQTSPSKAFWLIAIAALIWNAMGALNLATQLSPEGLANFPEKYQEIVRSQPVFIKVAFGIAAVTSVLGSIAMLMRRSIAILLFFFSFLAILVTLLHSAPLQMLSDEFSKGENVLTILLPIIISALLVKYSNDLKKRGWLR